jgi:hypothetical protein
VDLALYKIPGNETYYQVAKIFREINLHNIILIRPLVDRFKYYINLYLIVIVEPFSGHDPKHRKYKKMDC